MQAGSAGVGGTAGSGGQAGSAGSGGLAGLGGASGNAGSGGSAGSAFGGPCPAYSVTMSKNLYDAHRHIIVSFLPEKPTVSAVDLTWLSADKRLTALDDQDVPVGTAIRGGSIWVPNQTLTTYRITFDCGPWVDKDLSWLPPKSGFAVYCR